jgi:hypothetical protein
VRNFHCSWLDGALSYPGCEDDAIPYIEKKKEFEKQDKSEYCFYFNGITPPDSIYAVNPNESVKTQASESDKQTKLQQISEEVKILSEKDAIPHLPAISEAPSSRSPTASGTKSPATSGIKSPAVSGPKSPPISASTKRVVPLHHPAAAMVASSTQTVMSPVITTKQVSPEKDKFPLTTKDWINHLKAFLQFCKTEFPFLSIMIAILCIVILFLNPHRIRSILPSVVLCVGFLYCFDEV